MTLPTPQWRVDAYGPVPIMSEGHAMRMLRRLRSPVVLALLAIFVVAAAVVAFFVPTTLALCLVGFAAVAVVIGALKLARQL